MIIQRHVYIDVYCFVLFVLCLPLVDILCVKALAKYEPMWFYFRFQKHSRDSLFVFSDANTLSFYPPRLQRNNFVPL